MSRMRRLLISGTFLFGALAVIASAARLIVVMLVYPSMIIVHNPQIQRITKSHTGHNLSPNQLGFCTDVVYFTMLEVGLTIIAACLPTFGSLFSDSFKGRLHAAVRRFYTSLPRFRFSFSSINHTAMVNHSETRSVVGDSTSSRMGLETVATAEKNREVNEPQGQIRVTTATNRYSCTAEKFV
ncbi:hypothetical protein MMC22_003795 [Lobaria immixta]|nr:hypothetical protein [Lobaria immixta]